MKHFLSLLDFDTHELMEILNLADRLERDWQAREMPQTLARRRVGLWFYGQGFRNRVAFELGARSMGADVSFIPGELGVQEPLEDMGAYLGNWVDLLVVRARREADLAVLSQTCGIPVINARTERGHPCEIMGDLQYVRRMRGSLEGLKVVFVGEVTNLGRSWLEAAARLPVEVTQVAPEGWLAPPEELKALRRGATGRLQVSTDLDASLRHADVLYTDCWPKTEDPQQQVSIRQAFLPYQIDTAQMALMNQDGFFLPCPPVTRGEEVSTAAMQSPLCHNHPAKACLLHAQNAIMSFVMGAAG